MGSQCFILKLHVHISQWKPTFLCRNRDAGVYLISATAETWNQLSRRILMAWWGQRRARQGFRSAKASFYIYPSPLIPGNPILAYVRWLHWGHIPDSQPPCKSRIKKSRIEKPGLCLNLSDRTSPESLMVSLLLSLRLYIEFKSRGRMDQFHADIGKTLPGSYL